MGDVSNFWPVAILVLLGAIYVQAQSTNGQVSGIVNDSSGAAVVGAEITATNTATGVSYSNRTNDSGVYVLPQLLPGQYTITVAKEGFSTVRRSGLTVRTGDHLSLNFELKPGVVQESVTVTETAPLMNADQSASASVLDNKMITELPQLNRNTLDLTAVTPAIQGQGPLSGQDPRSDRIAGGERLSDRQQWELVLSCRRPGKWHEHFGGRKSGPGSGI